MEKLKFINDLMEAHKIPYQFGEWASEIQYPYTVGELPTPETIDSENGKEETPFIITGFHRGEKIKLVEIAEQIKKLFYHGVKAMINGNAIVVTFEGYYFIPSGEAELHKIQIDLKIQEWKVY